MRRPREIKGGGGGSNRDISYNPKPQKAETVLL